MSNSVFVFIQLPEGFPFEVDMVQAEPVGENLYKLCDVPLFASGLAIGDIVEVGPVTEMLRFTRLVQDGDQYTTTVAINGENSAACEALINILKQDERYSFRMVYPSWVAICCPMELLLPLYKLLNEGRESKLWEWGVEKMPTPAQFLENRETLEYVRSSMPPVKPAPGTEE